MRRNLLRGFCCFLSLLCVLLSFASCGQDTLELPDNDVASAGVTPSGSPLRAVYPISEIKLNFPGGSGNIVYSYLPAERKVTRETVLTEDTSIPGIAAESSTTVETYLFNSDGRLESYLLAETCVLAASNDAFMPDAVGSDGAQASDEVEITVDLPVFRRRFFYENGQLSAVTEEDLTGQASAEEQDPAKEDSENRENRENRRVEKRFSRSESGFIIGAVAYPMPEQEPATPDVPATPALPSEGISSEAAADSGEDLSDKIEPVTVDSDAASSAEAEEGTEGGAEGGDFAELYRESYEIGAGGLPMYLYGPTPGEVMGSTYTLSGRLIVGRQLSYSYEGQTLWIAKYSYGYDETGRVSRIDWTIRYDESWNGAVPDSLLLPLEGSYSMTLSYAADVPLYLAAACEELRLGSLEQGQCADREMRLLAPEVRAK